jgi:hypothetical protein
MDISKEIGTNQNKIINELMINKKGLWIFLFLHWRLYVS